MAVVLRIDKTIPVDEMPSLQKLEKRLDIVEADSADLTLRIDRAYEKYHWEFRWDSRIGRALTWPVRYFRSFTVDRGTTK